MAYVWMAVLLLAAAVWLSRPYWRPLRTATLRRKAANVAVYRTRLLELEAEVSGGRLDPDAASALREELAANLLKDAQEVPDSDTEPAQGSTRPGAALALTIVLALFAAVLYVQQDSWRTQQMIEVAQKNPQAGQALAIEAMVEGLAKRLQAQPEDPEGWAMLGRSYAVMERYADAARAYGEANRRVAAPVPELLVSEGEALALAASDRSLQGRPRQLFEQALTLAPEEPKALWYAGLAAAQVGDTPAARKHWLRLRSQDLPPALASLLDERLASIGVEGAAAPQAGAVPTGTGATPVLRVQIRLAPALANQPRPGGTLFVFAKAAEGPPMPLAAQKLSDVNLPLEVRLDDSMAMMPQLKLSQFDHWVVTARLSGSGDVRAKSGDWEGSRRVSRVESAQPVTVTIDTVVP